MSLDTFTAVTWNVFHDTPARELRPILRGLLDDGVTLILGQEMQQPEVRQMLQDEGLEIAFHPPQWVIAHVPGPWEALTEGHGVRLSPTRFFTGGGHAKFSEAVVQRLRHESGKTLRAMSYHTPAHVQVRDPAPARVKAAIESTQTWRRLADQTEADGILFGGDDNVDEGGAFSDRLKGFRDQFTGLKQVQAPDGTHGRRRLDDFRIKGLDALTGRVLPGGGDHKIHLREFRWQ